MITMRVALFIAALLGVLYALLSVVNGAETDVIGGMAVGGISILGWGVLDYWEEFR